VRDRLGIKPLYYSWTDGVFVFGSEIKSILLHPQQKREVDQEALIDFLTLRYVPAPKTIFSGIKKLLPGHYMRISEKEVLVKAYWDINTKTKTQTKKLEESILSGLKTAVESRLMSDVPYGAFLSGGIDSSTIVSLMSSLVEEPIKTFSVGFGVGGGVDEIKYAKRISEAFNTDHHELIVEPDSIDILSKVVWHFDEPLADSAAIPTFFLSELARKKVKVVLTGEGADEIFAGYGRYKAILLNKGFRRLCGIIPPSFREKCFPLMTDLIPIKRGKRFLERSLRSPQNDYVDWISVFNLDELRQLTGREMPEEKYFSGAFRQYFKKASGTDLLKQILYADSKIWLPDDLLMKVDKMTMANSLEARVPFLDHFFFDMAFNIPSKLKLKGIEEKFILKKSVSKIVPHEIIKRRKHGFDVPLEYWFDENIGRITDYLISPKREWINHKYVKHILANRGERNYKDQIFSLISLELWERTFIDREKIKKPVKTI